MKFLRNYIIRKNTKINISVRYILQDSFYFIFFRILVK